MDMILFEEHRLDSTTDITTALFIIDNVIVLSHLVESSQYSSNTLKKESYPICVSGRGFMVCFLTAHE